MTERHELIQLAVELRNATKALAELTCDSRRDNEWLASCLETEVRPKFRALRKALKSACP